MKRVIINRPPFGGSGITKEELSESHRRWVDSLGIYPADLSADDPIRKQYENGQQCGLCRFYIALSGAAGMDWGVCSCPKSQKDGQVVFEHFSCPLFSQPSLK